MVEVSRLPIAGTYNFRPVGARSLPDVGVYRSDALHRLTRDGRQALRSLGVETVIDLRSTFDRRLSGRDRLAGTGARVVSIPISGGSPATDVHSLTLATVYRTILTAETAALAETMRVIARTTAPVVVHCTAGKDRTGLASALLLRAVDVPVEDVVADYAATQENLAGEWTRRILRKVKLFRVPLTPAVVEVMTASPPQAMIDTLAWIDAEHGGVAAYLLSIGLTDDDLDALRRRLSV